MQNRFLDDIYKHQNEQIAEGCKRFFKTQKGEYSHHDIFLGVPAPILRKIAKTYFKNLTLKDLNAIIKNKHHEIRACAIMVLILQYQKTNNPNIRKEIRDFYLSNTKHINNWDLVDISASNIIGHYLYNYNHKNSQQILQKLADTEHLWSQRIAIVSTHYFIKQNQYDITLRLSEKFFDHKHDLMHKAVGWMLREIGKRDKKVLTDFLNKNISNIPRITLRYAIEKFDKTEKEVFISKRNKTLS